MQFFFGKWAIIQGHRQCGVDNILQTNNSNEFHQHQGQVSAVPSRLNLNKSSRICEGDWLILSNARSSWICCACADRNDFFINQSRDYFCKQHIFVSIRLWWRHMYTQVGMSVTNSSPVPVPAQCRTPLPAKAVCVSSATRNHWTSFFFCYIYLLS